jgi:hypothetical protein
MSRALARDGPTVEQLGFGTTNPKLASLARLFYLAAIRPDKSRGQGKSRQPADKAKRGISSMGWARERLRPAGRRQVVRSSGEFVDDLLCPGLSMLHEAGGWVVVPVVTNMRCFNEKPTRYD